MTPSLILVLDVTASNVEILRISKNHSTSYEAAGTSQASERIEIMW